MINYDKTYIKDQLTLEDIYQLLDEFGGEPEYTSYGILSSTICHNPVGQGSRKLYYYSNNSLFQCYSNCGSFDIFQLVINVAEIQWGKQYDLNMAVRWVANHFGISGAIIEEEINSLEDWKVFEEYERIKEVRPSSREIILEEYDCTILSNFNYNVAIAPWLKEGITQESLRKAQIGYYPGGDQITIPHFDKDGRFIGLRGRSLCQEDCDFFGKYRPIKVNGVLYNHPLGMNLYGINWNKSAISAMRKAIVYESEKSVLLFGSYFGWENNCSVACCGSNISFYQMEELMRLGVEEMIIAFDRQFQFLGDDEFQKLKANLIKLKQRYKNYLNISFIFDKEMITGYKDSPIDDGPEKFMKLFKERILV